MKTAYKMIALAVAAMSLTVNSTVQAADYNMQDPEIVQPAPATTTVPAVKGPERSKAPVGAVPLDQRIKEPRKPGTMAPEGWALLGAIVVAAIVGGLVMKDPNKEK